MRWWAEVVIYFSERAYARAFGVAYRGDGHREEASRKVHGSVSGSAALAKGDLQWERSTTRTVDHELSYREALEHAITRSRLTPTPLPQAAPGDLVKYCSRQSIIGGLPVMSVNNKGLSYAERAINQVRAALGAGPEAEVPAYFWMVAGEAQNVIDLAGRRYGREQPRKYPLPVYLFGSLDNYAHFLTYCGEVALPDEEWSLRYPHSFPSSPERLADVMGEIFDLDPTDVAAETLLSPDNMVEQAGWIIDRTFGAVTAGRRCGDPIGVNREAITVWGLVSDRNDDGAIIRPILIEHATTRPRRRFLPRLGRARAE
ncbi:hypothetical protein IU438_18945 [Nocardia cyriacigeorgica]|uniref:hypothetical protein n=1 Tax=Nocardia cyriacigeorgica TaxID=135487 RepID=UPI0018954EE7|nr:hypothetical protein [Nocardia cyriacigeorgica]MBF6397871.1 hypothetical protein [Nocardia cyriacigeorgica]MBF6402472.1 hypothetical protein [Nocardia cyriacigeorgica]